MVTPRDNFRQKDMEKERTAHEIETEMSLLVDNDVYGKFSDLMEKYAQSVRKEMFTKEELMWMREGLVKMKAYYTSLSGNEPDINTEFQLAGITILNQKLTELLNLEEK